MKCKCFICRKKLSKKSALKIHNLALKNYIYFCEKCAQPYEVKGWLKYAFSNKITGQNPGDFSRV